ncbi:DUF6953 family protein [Acinetobacter parvus]|uniref:DUF6953 family protein n=1 Tax=Acinetobacter parvus TaxID=134533 RepID=UPI003907FD0E
MEHLNKFKILNHEEVIGILYIEYDGAFVTVNEKGNQVIDKPLLKAFKEATATTVVWDKSEKAWRFREEYDSTSRSQ